MLNGPFVEMQFSRRAILDLVRMALVVSYPPGNPILPPTGREFSVADDGNVYVVTQTAFLTTPGSSSLRRGLAYTATYSWNDAYEHGEDIPANRCEVTQRLRLEVVRKVEVGGQRQDVDVGTIEGTLLVVLRAIATGTGTLFTVEPMAFTVETPGLAPAVVGALQRGVPGTFGTIQSMLPIARALKISRPTVLNAGISVSLDTSMVALRTQIGPVPSRYQLGTWSDFHAGRFTNHLVPPDGGSAPWALVLSPALVEMAVAGSVGEALAAHTDEFRLVSGVGAHWSPENSEPRVVGDFNGTVLIPCRPDYQVSYVSRLSTGPGGTLVSSGHVDWDGDDMDLFLCEVEVALSAGLVGGAIGLGVGGPMGMAIGAGIGLFSGFIGAMLAATLYTPDMSSPNCQFDGNSFTCTLDADFSIPLGTAAVALTLERARGTEEGMVLLGTFTLPPIPALRHSVLELDVDPFAYPPLPVSCGNLLFSLIITADDDRIRQFTAARATVTVRLVGEDGSLSPVPPTAVRRLSDDPLGIFPDPALRVTPYADRTVITIIPRISQVTAADYFRRPYGLLLEVANVMATRRVELGPVPRLTQDVIDGLRSAALAALNQCLAKRHDLSGGVFDLDWLVDPPPDGRPHERLWLVGVTRLNPGDLIAITTMDDRVLATGEADDAGIARLRMITDGDVDRVVVSRRGDGELATPPDLRIRQATLVRQPELVLDAQIERVETIASHGRTFAAVSTADGVAVHDVTFAENPRRLLPDGELGLLLDSAARRATWETATGQHVVAGTTLLVPSADGGSMQVYSVGPSVSA